MVTALSKPLIQFMKRKIISVMWLPATLIIHNNSLCYVVWNYHKTWKKGENMLVSMDVVEETAPGEIGSAVNEKC